MRDNHPGPFYPNRRMLVYAGQLPGVQFDAIANRQVGAVMFSMPYLKLKTKGETVGWWYTQALPRLQEWSQYRYLDSGVFTLMRKAKVGKVSIKNSSIKAGKSTRRRPHTGTGGGEGRLRGGPVKAVTSTKGLLPMSEISDLYREYTQYLEENLDDWDFVVNLDVDALEFEKDNGTIVPGHEVMLATNERLLRLCGPKLLPVWHPSMDQEQTYWKVLLDEFKYVAIGSDVKPTERVVKYACDQAHNAGVMVHGLGVASAEHLRLVAFDTADSSSWTHGVQYGNYPVVHYPTRAKTPYGISQRWLEKKVAEFGYDPAILLERSRGDVRKLQFEVGIALLQEREASIPPISTKTITRTTLYE